MNLILPISKQLTTGNEFKKKYIEDNNEDTNMELKSVFKGRVSYLFSMKSDMKKDYIGDKNIGNLKHFRVTQDIMDVFQGTHYTDALRSDRSTLKIIDAENKAIEEIDNIDSGGIYKNSSQAILFVYPNGKYGIEGENTNFDAKKNKFLPTFMGHFRNKNNIEKIQQLKKYSSKYASTINSIINDSHDKSCFVYCKLVHGSGALLFSKILQQIFGFSMATGNEKTPANRYAIITGDNTSNIYTRNIIDRFNLPDNKNGEIIKVLIGSTVISEGFSLKNVQEIHILTPHWNYSDTSQAIYRGIRLGSHKDLIKDNITPIIRIYQHVSVHTDTETMSLDLHKYEISEQKDISIKKMERLLKESSFDCFLNYERNRIGNENGEIGCNVLEGCRGSRECDYMDCVFRCDSMPIDEKLDLSTYHLYYNQDNINILIQKILELFKLNFSNNFSTINTMFSSVYSSFDILSALKKITNENIQLQNKYGYSSYLKEQNNIYFLIDNLSDTENYFNQYYCKYPFTKQYNSNFINIYNNILIQSLPDIILKIFNNINSVNDLRIFLDFIPIGIQEIIYENCLISKARNIKKNNISRDIILHYFSKFYKKNNNNTISTLLLKKYDILRCIKDIEIHSNKKWNICSKDILENEVTNNTKDNLEKNPYKIYGILAEDKFSIKDILLEEKKNEKNKKTVKDNKKIKYTGSVCSTWKKEDLYDILVNRLKVHHIYTDSTSIVDRCNNKTLPENIKDIYEDEEYNIDIRKLFINKPIEQFTNKKSTKLFNNLFKNTQTDIDKRTRIYTKLDEKNKDKELFIRMIYWNNKSISFMCEQIKNWFKNNDLCYDGSI